MTGWAWWTQPATANPARSAQWPVSRLAPTAQSPRRPVAALRTAAGTQGLPGPTRQQPRGPSEVNFIKRPTLFVTPKPKNFPAARGPWSFPHHPTPFCTPNIIGLVYPKLIWCEGTLKPFGSCVKSHWYPHAVRRRRCYGPSQDAKTTPGSQPLRILRSAANRETPRSGGSGGGRSVRGAS